MVIVSNTEGWSMVPSQPILEIRYDAEGFPASTNVPNGTDKLAVTWDEILWAAMTIGTSEPVLRFSTRPSFDP